MITIKYDDLFTFENLYQAYKKCCRGGMYKTNKIRFEQDIVKNLIDLQQQLQKRTYRLTSYRDFIIYEPKIRHIHCIAFADKIIQRVLCEHIFNEFVTTHSIYDSCAIQKGKGLSFAINRIKKHMRSFYGIHRNNGYILKMDIKNYYHNVDQRILKEYWHKHIMDDDLYNLIAHIIDSYKVGIPMGCQCSQIFANLYLDPYDHFLKEEMGCKWLVRYMDDLLVLSESKQKLQNVRNLSKEFLSHYHLELNENKTKIYPISQGCDFIGWHFRLQENGHIAMRLKNKSKKQTKQKIKDLNFKRRKGRITLKKYNQKLTGMFTYMKQGETSGLRRRLVKDMKFK